MDEATAAPRYADALSINSMATPALPPSSLVICSRNRPQMLSDTVDSVLAGYHAPAELVIIDQSDKPNETLRARSDPRALIHYVPSSERGLGPARNAGLAAAAHPIVAYIDDDMWVAPDWYTRLIGALVEAGPNAVVTGRVLPAPEHHADGFAPSISTEEIAAVYRGKLLKDPLAAGNMALYRTVTVQIGGFDPRLGAGTRFPSSEDNDFGYRLLAAGYAIHYVPAAQVYHRAWRTSRDIAPLMWRYGRGQGAFYAKHTLWQRVLHDARHYLGRAPWRALRGEHARALGDVAFMLGELSGAGEWLLTERGRR
jgi:GT2 family glycosyltransferase